MYTGTIFSLSITIRFNLSILQFYTLVRGALTSDLLCFPLVFFTDPIDPADRKSTAGISRPLEWFVIQYLIRLNVSRE
jgi:hypothetical protein